MIRLSSANKYHNQPQVVDGYRFPSKREANRYRELRLLERAHKITALRLQVRFPLHVNGVLITKYVADFCYIEDGLEVVEDAKGFITDVFRLKQNLMRAVYGIEIRKT